MAKKPKASKPVEYNVSLARELVVYAKTNEAMYIPEHEAQLLVQLTYNGVVCFVADYADRNEENPNEVCVYATEAGVAMFDKPIGVPSMSGTNWASDAPAPQTAPASTITPVGTAMGFDLVVGYQHPKRRSDHLVKREPIYPWDALQQGQAFFVPTHFNETTGRDSSVASAVAAQNRKVANTTQDKKFTIRKGERNLSDGSVVTGEWVLCEEYSEPRKRRSKSQVA